MRIGAPRTFAGSDPYSMSSSTCVPAAMEASGIHIAPSITMAYCIGVFILISFGHARSERVLETSADLAPGVVEQHVAARLQDVVFVPDISRPCQEGPAIDCE